MKRLLIGVFAFVALLASPALAQQEDGHGNGLLKVCKVAGNGVAPGTPFTFTATNGVTTTSFTVQAGSPPGGSCWLGGSFAVGSTVTVTETGPAGYGVTAITAAPNPPTSINLPAGWVKFVMGPGVEVVTFTNERKKVGYLEICKLAHAPATATFTFQVNPGGTTINVQANSCSPPVQVTAGLNQITETGSNGLVWTNCYTYQGGVVATCPVSAQTATVNVVAGNVGAETIVVVVNGPRGVAPDNDTTRRSLREMGMPPSE